MIAVVLDRRRARFFDISNGSAVELPGLRSPATPGRRYHSDRSDSPGRGERKYHHRVAEEERRHYECIAERLAALAGGRPGDQIVVAGQGPAPAAFQRSLPAHIAKLVVATAHLNPASVTPAAVHAAACAAAERQVRLDQTTLIAAIEEGVGTGRATNGARETLRALAKEQVRTLVVREDVRASGFRCGDSHRLVLSAADCRAEGPAQPVRDIIAAAIQAATAQNATIVTVRDPALAKKVDGLAALLRYSEDA
jgi:peptide subunit release factor 1 (eRF1)